MELTKAQKIVIDRIRELGGAAWIGSAIDKQTGILPGMATYEASLKKFWPEKEVARRNKLKQKYGLTNKGVWCSRRTFTNLLNLGLVEGIPGLPGAVRLIG